MALSDGLATPLQAALLQEREQARRAALNLAQATYNQQISETLSFIDDNDNIWKYVTINDELVRIEKCMPHVAQLEIPSCIDNLPVVELAPEACAELVAVESIYIPDTVKKIGAGAFRGCDALQTIRFSAEVDTFDAGWLKGCRQLEALILPGKLQKITSAIFEAPTLKSLTIGAGTEDIMPAAFANSNLERIEVSPDNPYIMSDFRAIYTRDGKTLVALAVPSSTYEVAQGCTAIGRKAFSNFHMLVSVELPNTIEHIDDYAYAKTGIEAFVAPVTLKTIGERAFYDCKNLTSATLNEGLESIGQNAFTDTCISELTVPKTVQSFETPIADNTEVVFYGNGKSFKIDADSPYLYLDDDGGLYAPGDNMTLIKMLNPDILRYKVMDGTIEIAPSAFYKHQNIAEVVFPASLRKIGDKAFRDCTSLKTAAIPKALEEVGDEAFLNTNICSLSIPATLTRIGALAFISEGAYKGGTEPSLKEITVDCDNPRYAFVDSMLIETLDSGVKRVIACTGQTPDVAIPDYVTSIASYAFSGLRSIDTLTISDAITTVDSRGLALDCLPSVITINLKEPVDGHSSFDIAFPQTARGFHHMSHAFGLNSFVNVEAIFAAYDNAIINASSFDSATEAGLDAYVQVKHLSDRLQDPVFMAPANKNMAISVLHNRITEFCLEIAKHDDKALLDALIELQIITVENIDTIIETAFSVQDASITNHLLDAKRKLNPSATVDFDAMFEL